MTKNRGIIYAIVNKINGKCYIGQTKEYYGIKSKRKYGLNGRWKEHVSAAKRNTTRGCVLLNRAIRKYGEDSFETHVITYCELDERDHIETFLISFTKTNNPDYGYNVCSGGNNVSGFPITEEFRTSISNTLTNPSGFMNIKQIKSRTDKSVIIGYKVSRDIDGTRHCKDFASSKYTLEENLELAKKWLEELKKGNIDTNKYKKSNDLPLNINYVIEPKTKRNVGYRVEFRKDGQYFNKCFSKSKFSMEKKLQQAIDYKDEILKNLRENQ